MLTEQYDLFAVSNHHGILGGGHYVAHGLVQETNQWCEGRAFPTKFVLPLHGSQSLRRYNFNDAYVTPISPEDIVTPASYILFYRHRDLDPNQFPLERGPPAFAPTEAEMEQHRQAAASSAIPWCAVALP